MPRDKLPKKDAQAAIRRGELHESDDPRISEWGNPARVMPRYPYLNT